MFYERRLAALSNLKSDARNPMKAAEDVVKILDDHAIDMPFSLIYLLNKDGKTASLAGHAGLPAASQAAPVTVELTATNEKGWPLAQVAASGKMTLVSDLQGLFGDIPARHWPDPPHSAAVLPLVQPGQQAPTGLLILGISPRRAFDDAYRRFFELASEKITSMIANADAFEQERRRAEALAELDRAKTTFFSNVSHEFRTPLTLMLGPMEELLNKAGEGLPAEERAQVSLAHRNGLRLLKLVNTLLDFSRIEAGRIQASYELTDLADYTSELVSVFRSAIEKAGLHLKVDCASLPEPVYIDREMWEKIVLNLLSNAFKFTFEGEIEVKLCLETSNAVLKVRDTGVGIPAEEIPRLFERFHRVDNMRSRTHEGSGIGLALVQELVKLHGGSIHAESRLGTGTTFTVSLPLGKEHLPPDRIGGSRTLASTAVGTSPFVEEALRWLPGEFEAGDAAPQVVHHDLISVPRPVGETEDPSDRPAILIVDDNADMRCYLARLLAGRYSVLTAPGGLAALAAAREKRPDLILSDVMMPDLDGFGLVREIRLDAALKTVPIILLSARAGEESRVEGLEYGADDYLIKPFSARELMARVAAHLDMARLRKDAAEQVRQSEERQTFLLRLSDAIRPLSGDKLIQDAAARLLSEHLVASQSNFTEYLEESNMAGSESLNDVEVSQAGFYRHSGFAATMAILNSGRDLVVPDTAAFPEFSAEERALYLARDVLASVSVPLNKEGKLVAALTVRQTTPRNWTPVEVEMIRETAERVWAYVERARMEEFLLKAEHDKNDALQKAIGMKDEFLSLVSHEFKTPLTVINSAVQAMKLICRDELSDKANQYLGRILQNSNRQLKLVNNLLDITRINAGIIKINLKNIDIVLMTRTITESIMIFAEQKGIRLLFSSTLKEKIIAIDEEKYERFLLNLLSNAIKFTPRGKSIYVRVFQRVVGGKCKVYVQVKDQGIGIPQDKQQLIFERFGQVDSSLSRQAEGTGIGLSLVKMFVEIMGGEITVESDVGKGSAFTALFPVTKKETPKEKNLQEINDNRLIQATAIEFSDIY